MTVAMTMLGDEVNVNRPIKLQALNLSGGKLEEPLGVAFCGQREGYDACARLLEGHKQLSMNWSYSGDQLANELAQCDFDCILLEDLVGTETAFTIKVRLSLQFPNLPAIIMLAKQGVLNSASMAFQQGFSDYLVATDLSPDNLYVQVLRAVNAKRVEQDYQAKIVSLSQQLTIDPSTGLNNHAFLDVHLASLLDSASQFHNRFAVLLVDVDHFRELKGKYGYEIGQRFIRAVASKLKGVARRADVFGRYGESTFLYLIDCEVSAESVEVMGRSLAEGLNFECSLGELRARASASIGAAIFPEHGTDAATLLRAAGAAMAQAKARGDGYCPASVLLTLGAESETLAGAGVDPCSPPVEASGISSQEGAPALKLLDGPATGEPQQAPKEPGSGILTGDDNRRSSHRFRTLKRGCISIQNGMSTIYCTVRDQSSGGARVAFNSLVNLPRYVDLELMEHGQKFRAEVRWTNGLFAGLKFLSAEEDPRSGPIKDVNIKR